MYQKKVSIIKLNKVLTKKFYEVYPHKIFKKVQNYTNGEKKLESTFNFLRNITTLYKMRCGKYKRIVNGIETDIITNCGYTWAVYFRNKPVPTKRLKKGLSPMHACFFHMFEQFCNMHHAVNIDNLSNSVIFTVTAESFKTKVLMQGVLQKQNHGTPPHVYQEEMKRLSDQRLAQGTVKATFLMGDSGEDDLVAASD